MNTNELTLRELTRITDQIKVLCFAKPGIKVFVTTRRIFIVERYGYKDVWTHNETQVLEIFNAHP